MSGIISYTHFGGRSGLIGQIPIWSVTTSNENNLVEGTYMFPGGSKRFDPAGVITNSGGGTTQWSNGVVMTASITGYYQLNYIVNVKEVPQMAGYLRAQIWTDNDNYYANMGTDGWDSASDYFTWTISAVAHLSVGQRATVSILNNGGDTTMDTLAEGDGFSGHLISAGAEYTS